MAQVVKIPTSPSKAEHRSPQHRMPSTRSLTNSSGMRSRSASLSVVNRGQSRENEQQAPQVLQDTARLIAAFSFLLAEVWNINGCTIILSDFLSSGRSAVRKIAFLCHALERFALALNAIRRGRQSTIEIMHLGKIATRHDVDQRLRLLSGHHPEKMLGVLVAILRLDRISAQKRGLC